MSALKQKPAKKASTRVVEQSATNPAQPVKGKIDYTAMRKDLIAAFPKTLARLAE